MHTDLFDFELPEERIALTPATPRDSARLLLVQSVMTAEQDAASGQGAGGQDAGDQDAGDQSANGNPGGPADQDMRRSFKDLSIVDLPNLLQPGDALVFNDTKVIPAALSGIRHRGEIRAKVSFNLHKRLDDSRWLAFARPAKKLVVGDRVQFGAPETGACMAGQLDALIEAKSDRGEITLAFTQSGSVLDEAIAAHGTMPLPPYIASKRAPDQSDVASYQTIFAKHDGAVAAPTAGLHFTDQLMAALSARGVSMHFVTLHVGAGTFLPVKVEETADHVMHAEWGEVSKDVADRLNAVRRRGGRIVAIGTTALRLLETAAQAEGPAQGQAPAGMTDDHEIKAFRGDTDIFITPGYQFRAVDLLWTNFHLPRSTLFMLVSAFAGLDQMQAAYAHAVREQYRFYSYGDACLLYPAHA